MSGHCSAGSGGSRQSSATGISSQIKDLNEMPYKTGCKDTDVKVKPVVYSHLKGKLSTSEQKNYASSELNEEKNSKIVSF